MNTSYNDDDDDDGFPTFSTFSTWIFDMMMDFRELQHLDKRQCQGRTAARQVVVGFSATEEAALQTERTVNGSKYSRLLVS